MDNTAQFRKSVCAVMDEPLAIAAGLMHFNNTPWGLEAFITNSFRDPTSPARGSAFEDATMYMLLHALDGTRSLNQVFTILRNPGSLDEVSKVQLISILGWDGDIPTVCDAGLSEGATALLGYRANFPEDVEAGTGIPFLLPDRYMGPDVWAMVRIGGQYIWLALQDKCLSKVKLEPAQRAIKSVTFGKFYTYWVPFNNTSEVMITNFVL